MGLIFLRIWGDVTESELQQVSGMQAPICLKVRPCLRRSGSRLREAPASAGVGRSRRQALKREESSDLPPGMERELIISLPLEIVS